MKQRLFALLAPLLVGALLLGAWEVAVRALDVPVYLVPAPSRIGATLVADAPLLFASLWVTVRIALAALACAVGVGVATSFVLVQSRWIEAALMPWAVLLQVTPIVAIAPLVIIWADDPGTALMICATVVALFPMISGTTQGLKSVDPGLAALFRLHGASRWQTLVRLRVPSAAPYFFAALKVSAGLALIGAVVAEFVAGTGGTASGLAYQILLAGLQLNIPRLFAALALITATGVAFYAATSALAAWALRGWHPGGS